MKKAETLTEETKELLYPIRQRPDLEPDRDFVEELHIKISKESRRKNSSVKIFPLVALVSVLLLSVVIILSSQITDEDIAQVKGFIDIEENEQITLIETIKYESEIWEGMNSIRGFDMEDGIVYLLDEAKSQVVMISEGKTTTFSIPKNENMLGVLEDIHVTKDKEIYVLNSGERVVYRFSNEGELKETYDLSQLELFFPDSFYELENKEMLLSQNQEQFASLESMSVVDGEHLPFEFERVNRKESKLYLYNEGKRKERTLFSELGLSQATIQLLTEGQIIYTQTVIPPVYVPLSETHIFALDEEGKRIGGARIPVEDFMITPQQVEKYITTEGNRMYLLIPEAGQVSLYEISIGKQFDSFIEEQADKAKIGFDYQTFGEPFPELEAELRELFKSGKLEYGNEQSLNGVAINEQGTVVIDFKDFLAPSPASAQTQEFNQALNSVTFETFPQIQEIYFQFDGSFSAWCYWKESTEEPWKRSNDSVSSFFELTEQEEEAYLLFQQQLDTNHLHGLEPISIAKLYVQAGFEKKYDVRYALYTDRAESIQWTKEEDENIPEKDRGTTEQHIKKFSNMDKGQFVQIHDYGGIIEYDSVDGPMSFQMIQNEDGVWQVAFMPLQ